MKEHAHHERDSLQPELAVLLRQIEEGTGRRVDIKPNQAIRDRARAVYVVSDPDPTHHLILYDPKYEAHLNHLVAHECGHIVRFASASPDDQTVAKTTTVTRE